jgi:POT family proton-dependent oligopeptide transporter
VTDGSFDELASASPHALKRVRTFFGEPRALAYLAFTEAWERFSYYGMTALLVLYMSQALFTPGHVEHVVGFTAFRGALESVFGPMTPLALASQIFGLYTGFVYFTPVFGGLIADRFIGRRNAVIAGAVMMSGGHVAMAFDQSFLLALFLLIVGSGFLKGNISTQVGGLYAANDAAGRTRGFSIFSMAINIGAVAGPILCGLLAQIYGWHAGFGLAGVLMLVGLATYMAGYRYLRDSGATVVAPTRTAPLTSNEWRAIAVLLVVIVLSIFQSIAFYQLANIGLVWINQHVELGLFGLRIPVAWFNAVDSFSSIVCVPFLLALWRWQAKRGGEPGEMAKMATGAFLCAGANLVLVVASSLSDRSPAVAPLLYEVMQGVAFIYYWPTLLALVSRAAPPSLQATMMGVVFMSLFVSNTLIGRLGGLYEQMTPTSFWAMHAAIGAVGGVLILLLKRPLERVLSRG